MKYLHRVKSSFNRFRANTDGNIAMMTAVTGLAVVGIIGLAIDSSGARSAQQELQSHLDAVSLAVATSSITKSKDQKTFALKVLAANGYVIDPKKLDVQMNANGEVSVTAAVEYANAFADVWDKKKHEHRGAILSHCGGRCG